jgi:hypothetical protein
MNVAPHGVEEETSSTPASGVFLLYKGIDIPRVKAIASMLNLKVIFGRVILSPAKDLA